MAGPKSMSCAQDRLAGTCIGVMGLQMAVTFARCFCRMLLSFGWAASSRMEQQPQKASSLSFRLQSATFKVIVWPGKADPTSESIFPLQRPYRWQSRPCAQKKDVPTIFFRKLFLNHIACRPYSGLHHCPIHGHNMIWTQLDPA